MSGEQHQENISSQSLSITYWNVIEYILLIGGGILALTLHAKWRYNLNIPGHHGMEFMAILVAMRLMSKAKYATSIGSLGMGLFLFFPVLGFSDPLMGFNYMLPGIALDVLYNNLNRPKISGLLVPLFAGLGYMMIPVSRIIVTLATGYPYQSFFKHGFFLPVSLFFVFGIVGGMIGFGISKVVKIKSK